MSHFRVENALNSISAGAPPQTPLGELTALHDPLAGLKRPTSKGTGGQEREKEGRGKGEKEGRGKEGKDGKRGEGGEPPKDLMK